MMNTEPLSAEVEKQKEGVSGGLVIGFEVIPLGGRDGGDGGGEALLVEGGGCASDAFDQKRPASLGDGGEMTDNQKVLCYTEYIKMLQKLVNLLSVFKMWRKWVVDIYVSTLSNHSCR